MKLVSMWSLLASLFLPTLAIAEWPYNPLTNVPLCAEVGGQLEPRIIADGLGGAIVAWQDSRNGSWDVYARRVLGDGRPDPAWPDGGRALCRAHGDQVQIRIAPDGAGGAIVVWRDNRDGTYDIYAQHVLANGAIAPGWPVDGVAIVNAPSTQSEPDVIADGDGGAIVVFQDIRGVSWDIYAHRIRGDGVVDPAWPANGRALCLTSSNQDFQPRLTSDGSGGAIVAWASDSNLGRDIHASRILASGAIDASWPANGLAVTTASGDQSDPVIAGDGAGGAIVAWQDNRGYWDIYAQRLRPTGSTDSNWPVNGLPVAVAQEAQLLPSIVSDGSGVYVAWQDNRGGGEDIYVHRIHRDGHVAPGWPINGRIVSLAANGQHLPKVVTSNAGAIVTWMDYRGGLDIYAHRVQDDGELDPDWPADGLAISIAPGAQNSGAIVEDGGGGAILAWQDYRGDSQSDVYVQHVRLDAHQDSPEPRIVSIRDVPNDQGGKVKISWQASYLCTTNPIAMSQQKVFRSVPPNQAIRRLAAGARETRIGETDVPPGDALFTTTALEGPFYWEFVGDAHYVPLSRNYSYVAETTSDSLADSNPHTIFMIVGYGTSGIYASAPDSGYSVDNLAPPTPSPFAATFTPATVALHWGASPATDFGHFELHRGPTAGFVPGPENRIAATRDTGFVDASNSGSFYKLAARDVHGNRSAFALVSPIAPVSALVSLAELDVRSDRVRIVWYSSGSGSGGATVERRTQTAAWFRLGEVSADGNGFYAFDDADVAAGTHYAYRLRMNHEGGVVVSDEVWVTPEAVSLVLDGARPNPVHEGDLNVRFTLGSGAPARLELLDVAGRRVASQDVGFLGGGQHTVKLSSGRGLSPGVYVLRLTQGAESRSSRVAVVE